MKYIQKRKEPDELTEYKKTPGVVFDGWHKDVREPVKKSLVEEQGYICCYCQKEIDFSERTIVEHFLPKEREEYKELQLDYNNLFASCDGGQGKRSQRDENGRRRNKNFPSHCDSNKENHTIPISPTDPLCESYFLYDENGSIFPRTSDKCSNEYLYAEETIRILNLDNPVLRNLRKAEFNGYIDYSVDELASAIEKLKGMSEGKFYNFCTAIICFLESNVLPNVISI